MRVFSTLLARSARRRAYADLLRLDDHLLRDVGLNRIDLHAAMMRGDVAGPTAARAHA